MSAYAEQVFDMEAQFWRCYAWLEAGLEASPMKTHSMNDLLQGLQSGELQLWPTANSACVTQISVYPTGLKVLHGLIAGGDLSEIRGTIEALEEYATLAGCQYATMQGRRGWARAIPGYRDAYMTVCKEL